MNVSFLAKKIAFLSTFLALFFVPFAVGQLIFEGANNGLFGGTVRSFAKSKDGVIFAGTNIGLFTSSNNGDTWSETNLGLSNISVSALSVNSNNILFVATFNDISKSSDNGKSWTKALSNVPAVKALVISDRDEVIAGTERGIFISSDNGTTWTSAIPTISVTALAIHPNGTIFAGTYDGIGSSSDTGKTWIQVNEGLSYKHILSMAIHPDGTLFVGTHSGGIFISTNNGATWNQVKNIFTDAIIPLLVFDKNNTLLASMNGNLYSSMDKGITWDDNHLGYYVVALIINSDQSLIAGSLEDGIIKSSKDRKSWTQINRGLTGVRVNSFAESTDGTLFVGTAIGLFISLDKGKSWIPTLNKRINSIVIHPNGVVFAGGYDDVYTSSDNGQSWKPIGLNVYPSVLFVHPNGSIFIGTWNGDGILVSSDIGKTWTSLNEGLTSKTITALTSNKDGVLYAGTSTGNLFSSSNNGRNWVSLNNKFPPLSRTITSLLAIQDGTILMSTYEGNFISSNNGEIWSEIKPFAIVNTWGLNAQGSLFAGTYNGVYASYDNGNTWVHIGMKYSNINSLKVLSDGILLVGMFGVYKSRVSTFINTSPKTYILLGNNYPNPFTFETHIPYSIPASFQVKIEIYDILGHTIKVLEEGNKSMGWYEVTWDGKDSLGNKVNSGIYICHFKAGTLTFTKRIILLK